MSTEAERARAAALTFLRAGAPAGSAALRVERFRRHTLGSAGQALVDDLLPAGGDATQGPEAPAGLRLRWVSPSEQALGEHEAHPAAAGLEDALLPACVSAAQQTGARVELVARHEALLSRPGVVDTLTLFAGGEGGERADEGSQDAYRSAANSPAPHEALGALAGAGFTLSVGDARAFALSAERVQPRHLAWLLMLAPIVFFSPALVVIQRSFAGVVQMLRDVLTKALRERHERLTWQVQDGTLAVRVERRPGETRTERVVLRDVVATSFAPAGVPIGDGDTGQLRALTASECVTLAHTLGAGDVTRGAESERVTATRQSGRALRVVLEWLVTAHRGR